MKKNSKELYKTNCPHCPSSDGYGVYDDGHGFCYVCHSYDKNAPESSQRASVSLGKGSVYPDPQKPAVGASRGFYESSVSVMQPDNDIKQRGITADSMSFYSVSSDGERHFYPYATAHKVRTVETKDFHWQGKDDTVHLFGMNLFPPGSAKTVTVVEGELDALAAFQMMGSKWPTVSVRNGAAGAIKDCRKAYEYLDSFETIVFCFDADEPGQKAAAQCAELFGGKSKIFHHQQGYKDACDYLKTQNSSLFVKQWWASENYVPDGIVQGTELHDLVMQPLTKANAFYPFDGLNKLTGGIREQEMVVVTAGSGLGKSQFLREVIWRLLSTTSDNIGMMFLEESVRKTALSLMSLAINKPLHLAETEASDTEKENAYAQTLGTDRLFFFDSFGSTAIDNIVSRVRFMAKGLECKYVFLDHVSIVISSQENGDERKALDEIMTKLRMIVQETGITLFAVSHLKRPDGRGHEEGAATSLAQLRGSGSIGQLADMVLGLERHAQAEDPIERNTTRLRVIKNRYSGDTGPACSVLYDRFTGRMTEVIDTL